MESGVRVVVATPLEPELRHIITDVDPGVELIVDDSLLPPQRYIGDHSGDPAFRRDAGAQATFDGLLARADVLYGVPDSSPVALAAAVRGNASLRWVQTMAAGGGAYVARAGLTPQELTRVTFTTSAGVHASSLAEFALFGVLAGAKGLPQLQRAQADRVWTGRWFMRQVSEQTVVVVGLGGIGAAIARLLAGVGARVLGVRRRPVPTPHVDEVFGPADLGDLVGRADAIVFALPGTASTGEIYTRDMMANTKRGAVVVNVGRGSVIDEPALIDALQSGKISSAYLDVFATEPLPATSPLWSMPQVVISPHTAALTVDEDRLIAELFADNLRRFLDGRPLRNVVDTHEFY